MVEDAVAVVVGMVEASVVAAAISLVAAPISLVAAAASSLVAAPISLGIELPAMASQNTKQRTLRAELISETEIISGTTEISFLEIPLGTEIPIRMIIRTTAIMTTMTVTIPMGNTHKPK